MIDQTSPPFSTHVKHCKRLGLQLGERFCSNLFKPQQACRVAWKLLMKRWWILRFYGLENSTNQSALLTVYLFRTFLFSKPSNVHLFHPAFWFGSLHIDFPVHWHAPLVRALRCAGCVSAGQGSQDGAILCPETPRLMGWGVGEGRAHCYASLSPFCFPHEPAG